MAVRRSYDGNKVGIGGITTLTKAVELVKKNMNLMFKCSLMMHAYLAVVTWDRWQSNAGEIGRT